MLRNNAGPLSSQYDPKSSGFPNAFGSSLDANLGNSNTHWESDPRAISSSRREQDIANNFHPHGIAESASNRRANITTTALGSANEGQPIPAAAGPTNHFGQTAWGEQIDYDAGDLALEGAMKTQLQQWALQEGNENLYDPDLPIEPQWQDYMNRQPKSRQEQITDEFGDLYDDYYERAIQRDPKAKDGGNI